MHHPSQSPRETPNQVVWEWTARIHASKSEYDTSFNVILFLGGVPKNPEEWLTSPRLVGKHSVMVRGGFGSRAPDITEGFVHLDNGIAKHSGLTSLEPKEVVPYLTKELDWRVQKVSYLVPPSLCEI
jgi:tyrosinase